MVKRSLMWACKTSGFGHVETIKEIKQSPSFLRNHYNIVFFYYYYYFFFIKRQTYLIKVVNWWLEFFFSFFFFFANSVYDRKRETRVWVNNITTFTVINVHCEGVDHTAPWNDVHTADKFSTFDLNVQNKPTSSEWNSVTVFFYLRTSNLGRHERYCYLLNSNTDKTSLTCLRAAMVCIFDAT